MIVVEQTHPENALPATTRGYARDTITLGWDDRLRVRGQRRSASERVDGGALATVVPLMDMMCEPMPV